MSSFTFSWPKGPQEVILTGTFDNWAKTLYLVKQADESFSLTVPFPKSDEPVLYKYVVDGDWVVSTTQRISKDESGNENNILEASDLIEPKSVSGSSIPEAGGLIAATGLGAAGIAAVAATTHTDDLKTTVLPSTEGVQTTLGEPGIHVPKDPEALAAFEQVRDVDPKTLNEPELSAEEKKKQKKKVKRTQYKNKKKKKAAGDATSTTEGETTEEQTPEPTSKDEELAVAAAATAAGAAGVTAAVAGVPVAAEHEVEAPKEVVPETKAEEAVPEVKDAEEVVPETKAEEEVVPETKAEEEVVPETKAEEEVPEVKEAEEEIPKTLDPKAEAEPEVEPVAETVTEPVANGEAAAVEKEVDASPVVKKPKSYESDEEIVIAQGTDAKKDIAAQIAAQEGDVTVEEIQPTESEKARLTSEANIPKAEAKVAATKAATPAKAKVPAASSTADKKKKEKKPNFLVRLFKKLGD
ncbi:regulation of G-protein function [Scheffersomyces coipomensis]|uniref:regulation of G-protein function n=1 Tax=Scheffersomyces coipomensis TaxID=1788519 RepID=UPI00315C98AF